MKSHICYTKPSITDLEIAYVNDAICNGWGEHCYDYITRFEKVFRDWIGIKHAIATSSCTGALQMGLKALGIGPNDEIILADTNWIATLAPIIHLGATPVFVDIRPDTWCLDPKEVDRAITPKTKAIIATHLYGNLCDMKELKKIAFSRNILLIEDAAEAIGSMYSESPGRWCHAGSMGTFGTFSFHGTKTITTGEGGMFVTNNEDLYEEVLTLSNHGRVKGQTKQFWPERIGFKYKMSNVQAAIGCAQMDRIEELVKRKQEIMDYYRFHLGGIAGVTMNPEPNGCINGYWMPTIVFDRSMGITREMLLNRFKVSGIDARVFFWPLSSLPMCVPVPKNKMAYDISERAINLPSFHDMTEDDQDRVIDVIRRLIE